MKAPGEKTGLEDFGEPGFEEGLDRLLQALRSEARLTALGRLIAREEILTPLVNRLRLVDYHRRYPEIGDAPITAPVFIIGMGRSGTTVLHELLALDPQFRVTQTWEVDHPLPPPETASYATDPRIDEVQKQLERTDLVLPDFKKIHRLGARLPQECVRFTTGEFLSLIFWTNIQRAFLLPLAEGRGGYASRLPLSPKIPAVVAVEAPAQSLGIEVSRAPVVPRRTA